MRVLRLHLTSTSQRVILSMPPTSVFSLRPGLGRWLGAGGQPSRNNSIIYISYILYRTGTNR